MPGPNPTKHCTRCDRILSTQFFSRNRRAPDGRSWQCKDCAAAYRRRYEPVRRAVRSGRRQGPAAASRQEALAALSAFVAREGHTRTPPGHFEGGFPLGRWVARKRSDRNRGHLSPEVERALEDVPGWTWDPYAEDFGRGLEALRRFARREGHSRVPNSYREGSFRIGAWVSARRHDHRVGRLAPERAAALAALPGWSWSGRDVLSLRRDEEALVALRRFAEREGHACVPFGHGESGVRLGQRVRRWRVAQEAGRLDPHWARTLEAVPGWTWDPRPEAFHRGLERLRRFVAREGHARVPAEHVEDGFKLGWWVASRRRDYRKGRLAVDHRRALEAVPGWLWAVNLGA